MKYRPWKPASYSAKEVGLIRALARGDASPEQQQEALRFIVVELCKTYELSYQPDSDRDTSFAEGRRFVGLQIVKLSKLDVTTLRFENVGESERTSGGAHGPESGR